MFRSLVAAYEAAKIKRPPYHIYAKSISGPALGYCLRMKTKAQALRLEDRDKLEHLAFMVSELKEKSPDKHYKKLHTITDDESVKAVMNDVVLVIEKVKKELDTQISAGETEEEKLKDKVATIYRGRYIISQIAKAYGLPAPGKETPKEDKK